MSFANLQYKVVKTRKQHRCLGCLNQYPAGTEMRVVVNAMDGDGIDRYYLCAQCDEFITEFPDEVLDDFNELSEGCVNEAMREREFNLPF